MKKIISFCIMSMFFSCKKSDSPQETLSTFGFTANTIAYNWNYNAGTFSERGSLIIKLTASGGTSDGYLLQGWNNSQGININLFMKTSTLTVSTYKTITTNSSIITNNGYLFNGIKYFPLYINDSVVVTITRINNDHADGNFSALMHDVSSNKVDIVNGVFNNVQITN